ncbi:hypothetical protein LA080_008285 [Diaporthe eres]|nr:hypothetical protein LA080_008285 [Diaporthe eres]
MAIVLVQSGTINTEEDYERALQTATEFGFISLLPELQKPNFKSFRQNDMIDRQKVRMTRAIKGGQLGVLSKVLGRASDPSTLIEANAVATAASYGHNDIIRFLLSKGMGIEAKGEFGTPLRSACLMGRKSTVQLLLEQGAEVNSSSSENDALHAAAGKGHAAIVKMLLRGGADVNHIVQEASQIVQLSEHEILEIARINVESDPLFSPVRSPNPYGMEFDDD